MVAVIVTCLRIKIVKFEGNWLPKLRWSHMGRTHSAWIPWETIFRISRPDLYYREVLMLERRI